MSSPPGPTPLSLPRQRPNNIPPKSRKLSTTSLPQSAHPLRQTSFPPSEYSDRDRDGFSPAESLDSLDDADIRSAVGEQDPFPNGSKKRKRGEKRPRGRPPKDPRAHAAAARKNGAPSVNGSETTNRRGGDMQEGEHDDEDGEDSDAGPGGEGKAAGDFSLLPAEMDRDKQRKFLFREAIPGSHQARYDSFNTVKLKPAEVRKLVNNVLSQSVPANVVTVVGSYTKMFAGMLIEAAREVQGERTAVREKRADGERNEAWGRLRGMGEPPEVEGWETDDSEGEEGGEKDGEVEEVNGDGEKNREVEEVNGNGTALEKDEDSKPAAVDSLPDGDPDSSDEQEAAETTAVAALPNGKERGSKTKKKKPKLSHPDPLNPDLPEHDFATAEPGAWNLGKFVEDCDRGPLQPDHLREALRRYRRSRAGGSVGFTGISLEGREGVASRMGGRRLFR